MLRASVENPWLGSPDPQRQRDVPWELEHVILRPLCIIRQLLEISAISNALVSEEPTSAALDALGSVEKFLLGIDWNIPKRSLMDENFSFGRILEEVVQIHHCHTLSTLKLADALHKVYSAGMCFMCSVRGLLVSDPAHSFTGQLEQHACIRGKPPSWFPSLTTTRAMGAGQCDPAPSAHHQAATM